METNYMSNGKVMIIHLIAGLIKMILYKNESILSKSFELFRGDTMLKLIYQIIQQKLI